MNIYISIPRIGSGDAFKERVYEVIRVLQGKYEKGSNFYYPTLTSYESLEGMDLGPSISRLLMCDGAHFTSDWENDKACRIEHEVCKVYGIKIWKD